MNNRNPEGDAAAERLERRWFAAFKAASSVRAECEDLLDAMAQAEAAWNDARARLAERLALVVLGSRPCSRNRCAGWAGTVPRKA